jgi:hypothetical protein
MQPNWNNMTSNTAMVGGRKRPDGPDFGIVGPSVCLSDWDKRETPVRKRCLTTTCDGRQNKQRRGQDSIRSFSQLSASKRIVTASLIAVATCACASVIGCAHGFSPVVSSFVSLRQTRFVICLLFRGWSFALWMTFANRPLRTPLNAEVFTWLRISTHPLLRATGAL